MRVRRDQELDGNAHDYTLEQEVSEEVHIVGLGRRADVLTGVVICQPVGRHRELEGVDRDDEEQQAFGHRLDVRLPELEWVEALVMQAYLEGLRVLQQVFLRILPVEDGEPANRHRRKEKIVTLLQPLIINQ